MSAGEFDTEWDIRDDEMSRRMVHLIRQYCPSAKVGLDVGCKRGRLTSVMASASGIRFCGLDPKLEAPHEIEGDIELFQGRASRLPFPDGEFDVVTFISVYEHIPPPERRASIAEILRVLGPRGCLIGQIPNMYFPIELHSKLPFQSYLPREVGRRYCFACSPHCPCPGYGVSWYRVGPGHLRNDARAAGFREAHIFRSNYSESVLPAPFRRFARILDIIPLGFDFCFTK